MIGPTIIQHSKTAGTYETAMRSIAKKCKLENTTNMFVVTGRQPALITAILNIFKKCILLRCTRHFENNCKDYLKQIGIHGSMKEVMLDVVFGENGLVEAENKLDVKEKMKNALTLLSEVEQQCLSVQLSQDENGKFAAFIKSHEKIILRKIIRSSRRNAFQMEDDEIPPRVYTNQSETVNSILSAKKLALGYSKKEDISKAHFVKYVWQGVVNHQEHEIEKATINQCVEYRLAPGAQYLSAPVEVWYQWSQSYRQKYTKLIKCFQKKRHRCTEDY